MPSTIEAVERGEPEQAEGQNKSSNNPASDQTVRYRSACDECRERKLKCPGELPACSRCTKQGLKCNYSIQQRMGRPRRSQERKRPNGASKRRRLSSEDEHVQQNEYDVLTEPTDQLLNSLPPTSSSGENNNAFDMSAFDESAFTGSGLQSIQPWMADWGQDEYWPQAPASTQDGWGALGSLSRGDVLPRLTPDNSTNSSPPNLLDLPPELRDTTQGDRSTFHVPYTQAGCNPNRSNAAGASTAMLLDPTLNHSVSSSDNDTNLATHIQPKCACTSALFLQINNLEDMERRDPTFTFPFALHPLRQAMQSVLEALDCEICPSRFITAIQNTQMLGTVIMTIAERFTKILKSISAEAKRADDEDEVKNFRLADLNTSTSHLHTNGLGCAAAFNLSISPDVWRNLAKKVVKAEVYGPVDGNECCIYYMQLIERLENRHTYWLGKKMPDDFPVDHHTGQQIGGINIPKEDHLCLRYASYGRKLVEGADWE